MKTKVNLTTIVETYAGNQFSAAEEPGALIVIRWKDFATMRLPDSAGTAAIRHGLWENDGVDALLSRLGDEYEGPEVCGRLPLRLAA